MPKEVFGTPRLYNFEGRMYYGPEKIEKYLTRIFGNYIKLPPANVQKELTDKIVDAIW